MYINKVDVKEFVELIQNYYDDEFSVKAFRAAYKEWLQCFKESRRKMCWSYYGSLPPYMACVASPNLRYDKTSDFGKYEGDDDYYFVVIRGGELYGTPVKTANTWGADVAEYEEEDAEEYEGEEAAELAVC